MAGPTAAESLIKAAAAGEGAREGGGERRKRCKEVGGSTGRGRRLRAATRFAQGSQIRLECGTRSPRSTRVRARWVWGLRSLLLVGQKERTKDPGQRAS